MVKLRQLMTNAALAKGSNLLETNIAKKPDKADSKKPITGVITPNTLSRIATIPNAVIKHLKSY
ncbi:hypothetical protein SZ10_13185 [Vibrio parahaemolyticus]|nr:hypothetical protein SZ10_13185 [Vibrio parahaemolyticus]